MKRLKELIAHVIRVKPDTLKQQYEAWELSGHALSLQVQESTDVAEGMIEEWTSEVVRYKNIKRQLDAKLRG